MRIGLTNRAALAAILALSLPASALASDRTLDRCEALGVKDLAASGQTGTIRIDRNPDHLAIDRYEGKVGKLAIPTVYHGRASVDTGAGTSAMRFICLDGGNPKPGPVFFYLLPLDE